MRPLENTSLLLTPLHLAAAANWPPAVKLLLASGADQYAQDSELCFPIDFAIHTGCLETIKLLLEGDCISYFTAPRKFKWCNVPGSILFGIQESSELIQNALLGAAFRQKNSLENIGLYQDIAHNRRPEKSSVLLLEKLISGGFPGLNSRDNFGFTPLMRACYLSRFQVARVLIENGASISTRHRDSGLTAGHFLALGEFVTLPLDAPDSELCAKLLEVGFDVSNITNICCRCSPGGFTPITAVAKRHPRNGRAILHSFILCLRWPTETVEKEVRTFAIAVIFDRLGMTHTCVNSPGQQILEEDREEIESEEEEFNNQLQELIGEYDMLRVEFSGGPLEFLDYFFELHEQELLDSNHWSSRRAWNYDDKDLLGPGQHYNYRQFSFTGREILYRHTEEVREENMLALLFDKGH
jgi:hypothetical protein